MWTDECLQKDNAAKRKKAKSAHSGFKIPNTFLWVSIPKQDSQNYKPPLIQFAGT